MAPGTKPKAKRSAAKNNRRGEVRGRIQKTSIRVDEQRKDIAAKKRKLQELSDANRDGSNPEQKAEYESLEAEVTKLDGKLMEWETQLETLRREDEDTGMSSDDDDDGTGLFVTSNEPRSSTKKPDEPPLVDLTKSNGESTTLFDGDSSDDEGVLFTPAQARETTGESYGGKIVAWKEQGRSMPVIVRYGPRNAAKYERSTAAKEDIDFDEETTDKFGPDHRLGDERVAKKLIRRRREFKGIEGLAYNCDVEDLKPKEKGEKRRVPPLEILVKWEIDGEIKKRWEVRSSIRHVLSSVKFCDTYIYETAKYHANRYQEWQNGKREAKDKSPSPDTISRPSPTPEPIQREIKSENGSSGNILSAVDNTTLSKRSNRAAMLRYREQWCDLKGIDPEDMDEVAEGRFLKAWNGVKDTNTLV